MAKQKSMQHIFLTVKRTKLNNSESSYDSYTIPFEEGMTYMDALRYIADEIDEGFSFYEHSCKRGFCGSCLIDVNGKKLLSCRTLIDTQQPLTVKPALAVTKDFYPKL